MAFELAWLSAEVPPPPESIAIEAGFPVSVTRTFATGSATTLTTASMTASSGAVLYVVLAVQTETAILPATIADSGGLTWTNIQSQTISAGSLISRRGVYIWRATTASAVSRTVTATISSSVGWAAALSVFSFTAASGTAGVNGGAQLGGGGSSELSVALSVSAGSYVVGGGLGDDPAAQTARSGSTIVAHAEDGVLFSSPTTWQSTTTTSAGSVTVGTTMSINDYAKAAAEVLTA